MNTRDARQLGDQLSAMVAGRQIEAAWDLLAPVLDRRTPFRLLDVIGERLGDGAPGDVNSLLDAVAARKTMGGWVVIASALRQQLPDDFSGAFERCRAGVIAADVWYATDIFGERLPGPALVSDFEQALGLLQAWQNDSNRWIRRIVGVAVHLWAKRSRGDAQLFPQAVALLDLLSPMFEERQVDVIKGVGWGFKTLGKQYPDLAAEWLAQQAARPHRKLMMRKATTYLPAETRRRLMGEAA